MGFLQHRAVDAAATLGPPTDVSLQVWWTSVGAGPGLLSAPSNSPMGVQPRTSSQTAALKRSGTTVKEMMAAANQRFRLRRPGQGRRMRRSPRSLWC